MCCAKLEDRYGKSKGHPTEEGLILDVEASLRALRDDAKSGVDTNKIVLFGRSLGGAVALGAAERYPDLVSQRVEWSYPVKRCCVFVFLELAVLGARWEMGEEKRKTWETFWEACT